MEMLRPKVEVTRFEPRILTNTEAELGRLLATLFDTRRKNRLLGDLQISRTFDNSLEAIKGSMFRIAFSCGADRADLYLGLDLIAPAVEILGLNPALIPELSRWELTSCLNLAWVQQLADISRIGLIDLALIDAGSADDEAIPTGCQGLWFTIITAQKESKTCLVFETPDHLASILNRIGLDRLPSPAGVGLQLGVQLYQSQVQATLAEGLEVGDVFLIPSSAITQPVLQIDKGWRLQCGFDGEIFRPPSVYATNIDLAQFWQGRALKSLGVPFQDVRGKPTLNHWNTDMLDQDPPGFKPADLEVDLQFMAGSLRLPISELSRLGPGYVFSLNSHVGEHITVLANGSRIAVGELVSIQGELGVRVLRMIGGV